MSACSLATHHVSLLVVHGIILLQILECLLVVTMELILNRVNVLEFKLVEHAVNRDILLHVVAVVLVHEFIGYLTHNHKFVH